ncbi:MAG: hypothetical protein HY290_33485 [Planctomycetia bacterium]|nr:hypothetical protein [Planctomycetia bacterium]
MLSALLLNRVRQTVVLAVLATATAALPGLAPAAPAVGTVIHISAGVRRIIHRLRQLDIPLSYRRSNWIGRRGQGSCVHASMRHLFHWQGRHDLAEWWATNHSDGETAEGLAAKLDRAQVRYAETRNGDEAFLEWTIRTRRGAAVVVQNGAHMVNLVGLDRQYAHILDSNAPQRVQQRPRGEFLNDWKRSGGWAVTPLGTPAPPDPWIVK